MVSPQLLQPHLEGPLPALAKDFHQHHVQTTQSPDNDEIESQDAILATKGKVYNGIVQSLTIEGYPMEGDPDFKESNINRLVYATIGPILSDFISKTGRLAVQLWCEKEIVRQTVRRGDSLHWIWFR